jgi:hypothetical protein
VLLLLSAFFVWEQGAQILAPLADLAGLSTHYTQENQILAPTLYSVPAVNYTYAAEELEGGGQFVGSFAVAGGREVGFYVMNEGNFSLWRAGRPASLILADPSVISPYNFTLSPTSSGTYYFVFDNRDSSPQSVFFSLSSVQNVVVLSPFVQYSGIELLLLGAVVSYFGLTGGKRKVETKTKLPPDTTWKCRFCGASNAAEDKLFCAKCGRAQN